MSKNQSTAQNNRSKPSFKGIPLSKYTSRGKEITIYRLEAKDASIIDKLLNKIKKKQLPIKSMQGTNYNCTKEIMKDSLESIQKLLRLRKEPIFKDTSAIFLAVEDKSKKPCGLLVGNMAKINKRGDIVYSNRNRPNESEIDWLVAWNPEKENAISGTGQILVHHFFRFCKKISAEKIFVRSERPSKSFAKLFYGKMGFKVAGGPMPWEGKHRPLNVVNKLYNKNPHVPDKSIVYPMEIALEDTKIPMKTVSKKFNEMPLERASLEPEEFVNLD